MLCYEKVNDETGRPMHKSWGNAIWFDDAVEKMGADVMRWMFAAQTPSQNLNFGYGPANEVKRRLLTLWNTYNFFVLYAVPDGYAAAVRDARARARPAAAAAARPLAGGAHPAAGRRVPRRARRAMTRRGWCGRSRRTWTTSPTGTCGCSAPAVLEVGGRGRQARRLRHALVRAGAGRALRRAGDAVPGRRAVAEPGARGLPRCAPERAPVRLSAAAAGAGRRGAAGTRWSSVRAVVRLGREARSAASVKLRQPLAEVIVATDDPARREHAARHVDLIGAELGVKAVRLATSAEEFAEVEVMPLLKVLGPKYGRDLGMIRGLLREGEFTLDDGRVQVGDWTLEPSEFELRTRAREGFSVLDGDGFAVALDTELTPELELEGEARDLIRAVQVMRQEAGLEVTDRIRLTHPQAPVVGRARRLDRGRDAGGRAGGRRRAWRSSGPDAAAGAGRHGVPGPPCQRAGARSADTS